MLIKMISALRSMSIQGHQAQILIQHVLVLILLLMLTRPKALT